MEDPIDTKLIDALSNKPYPQNLLLTPPQFRQLLNQRSTSRISEAELEAMDRVGLIHPLLRVATPHDYHQVLSRHENGSVACFARAKLGNHDVESIDAVRVYGDVIHPQEDGGAAARAGAIAIATKANYSSWTAYAEYSNRRRKASRVPLSSVYYHPYQVHRALAALKLRRATLQMDEEPDAQTALRLVQAAWNRVNSAKLKFSLDASWKKVLLLYLLIEDRYLPDIRGIVSYADEIPSEGENWTRQFSAAEALQISGFSLDQVKMLRKSVAIKAKYADGNFHWFPLIRHMELAERERASNSSLIAWDYHEFNEMLGDFLADLTSERQPLPDDVLRLGTWKTAAYGFPEEQIDYKRANALPSILRYYGLDPRYRVWVFVEGMTEYNYIESWFALQKISMFEARIMLVSLESHGGVKASVFKRLAANARSQNAAVFVLIDADGQRDVNIENLNEWIKSGYIPAVFEVADLSDPVLLPIGGLVWEPCFEDSNFSFDQQVAAWRHWLVLESGEQALDEAVFQAAVDEARSQCATSPTIKAIESVTNVRFKKQLIKGKTIKLSKPEMGLALATIHVDLHNPINQLLANIHYMATLETAVYRPDGNEPETRA